MIAQRPHEAAERFDDREPSLNDTKMGNFRDNPGLYARLTAKLEQYRARSAELAFTHPEQTIALNNFDPQLEMFKEKILEAILWLAEDGERDFEANPVMMIEIASIIMQETHENVAEAVSFPFRWSPADEEFFPDTNRLSHEASHEVFNFSLAYGIIRVYTLDKASILAGGRGLPEVASAAIVDLTD